MANVVNKIFTDRMGGRKAAEYIGVKGDLFYDSDVGDLRISDGVTPGGKPTGGSAALGIYRHYQAGCNIFRNTNDQDIAQIIIHNAEGRVDYINYTPDTDNDDFYVTGLQHQSENENTSWTADKIIVLNVYSKAGGDLAVGDLRTFVRKFIDTVLYTSNDQRVNEAQIAKNLFYENIEILTQSLPAGSLFDNFTFEDQNRIHWPEYSQVDNKFSANFKVHVNGRDANTNEDGTVDSLYDSIGDLIWVNAGTGYEVGDKITVNGGQMGGVDGANDFTLTVTGLKSGNITELQLNNAGTNFSPTTFWNNTWSLSGGNGSNAAIFIKTCTENGAIVEFETRNGGGYDYQVGDILTAENGGDTAEFEVISVGTNGIDGWTVDGSAYIGSPARVANGAWPVMSINDGRDDQYDDGNWISTDVSSHSLVADFNNNYKMTITGTNHPGSIPLQAGMTGIVRNPNDITEFSTFTLLSQATDNSNVWYIDNSIDFGGAQVRIDGIPYGYGQVQSNASFSSGEYVTVYDQSIFAMIAFGTNVNSVYYNGNMGADSSGTKDIEVLFGINGGAQDSIGIPQRLTYDGEYTLQTSDAGKHIYNPNGDNTIYVPVETTANFPVGSAVTFVSTDNPTWISPNDGGVTQIYGAGFNTTSNWWAIPANSMGTLLKIAPERWIVSGAGLYNDD